MESNDEKRWVRLADGDLDRAQLLAKYKEREEALLMAHAQQTEEIRRLRRQVEESESLVGQLVRELAEDE